MAKTLTKMVQEPEDTLIMARAVVKRPGAVYIATKLQSTLLVGGTPQKVSQEADGIVGFMLVFDDYEKALKWVDGDPKMIATGIAG